MGDPYNSADEWGARATANPYAAPAARVAEVSATNALVKSTRLNRLGAVLLDTAVLVVPAIVIAVMLPSMQVDGRTSSAFSIAMGVFGLGIIAFVIYQFVMLYRHGQTLGKKILGIRIVRSDGSRAGFGRLLLLRYLIPGVIGAIPFIGILFSLIDPLFIFGDEKRCVHDLLADTIVVDV